MMMAIIRKMRMKRIEKKRRKAKGDPFKKWRAKDMKKTLRERTLRKTLE